MSKKSIEFVCAACGKRWDESHADHCVRCVQCDGTACRAELTDDGSRELRRKASEIEKLQEEAGAIAGRIRRLRAEEISLKKEIAELQMRREREQSRA